MVGSRGCDCLLYEQQAQAGEPQPRVSDSSWWAAVEALTAAGYRSLAPVDPIALADPLQRREWQSMRNMQVFSFWDSTNTRPTVDVMLAPAVPFEDLWGSASVMNIGGHEIRVASIEHLIRMKAAAGRTQDLADIERLQAKLEG